MNTGDMRTLDSAAKPAGCADRSRNARQLAKKEQTNTSGRETKKIGPKNQYKRTLTSTTTSKPKAVERRGQPNRCMHRRWEALPSSRFTRLNPSPLSDPGGVPLACLGASRTAAFQTRHVVGFRCDCSNPSCGPPSYIFRGSIPRPVFSPYLCFAHRHLSTVALRFGCRPGG